MNKNPRQRIVELLYCVLSNEYTYKRSHLADKFKVSKNTIHDDVKFLKRANINWDQNDAEYCAILPNNEFKELRRLLPFSNEEQTKISSLIDRQFNTKEAKRLKLKFRSLLDLQQLGIRALRRPELEKIDELEVAKKKESQVKLIGYRSNSNEIKDRIVEPFFIDTENNLLQAFDLGVKKNRHFKINRIERIENLKVNWSHEEKHRRKETDVFRIADSNQEYVALDLNIYAYNYLLERFPNALKDITPGSSNNSYHFASKVNHQYLGLSNFILANPGHVKIHKPDSLKKHIKKQAQLIIDKINEDEEFDQSSE